MYTDQFNFNDFIQHLNEQETANPNLVIDEFFGFSSLSESRKLLWSWLRAMIGEDFDHLEDSEQNRLLRFFENLEKLLEAAYIMKVNSSST